MTENKGKQGMTQSGVAEFRSALQDFLAEGSILQRMGLQSGDLDPLGQIARNDLVAGNVDAALGGFARLVMVEPANADYQIGLAEAALAAGHAELAMHSAAVVIAERPRSPVGYFLSGRAALAMGEIEVAIEDLVDAARLAEATGDRSLASSAQQLIALSRARS